MRQRSNSENPGLQMSGMHFGGIAATAIGQGLNQLQSQYQRLRAELLAILRDKIITQYPAWTQSISTWLSDNPHADSGAIIEQLTLLQMSSAKAGSGWSGDSNAKELSEFILKLLGNQYTPLRFLRALEADRAQQNLQAQQIAQAQQAIQAMLDAQQEQRLPAIPELEAPVAAAPVGKTSDELREEITTLRISEATLKARLEGRAEEIRLLTQELKDAKSAAGQANQNFRQEVGAFRITMGEMNRTMTSTMGDMNTTMNRMHQKVEILETTLNESRMNESRNTSMVKDEPELRKVVPVITKRVSMGKQFLAKDLLSKPRIDAICAMGDLLATFKAQPIGNDDSAIYACAIECVKLLASLPTMEDCFNKFAEEGSTQANLLAKTPAEFREYFKTFSQLKDAALLTQSPEKLVDLKNCLKGMFSVDGYNVPELKVHFPSKGNGTKALAAQPNDGEKKPAATQKPATLSEHFKVPGAPARVSALPQEQAVATVTAESQSTTGLNL